MKILLVGHDKLGIEYGGGQIYVQNIVDGFLLKKQAVAYMSIAFADVTLPRRVWTDYKSIKELQLILPQAWQLQSGFSVTSDIVKAITDVFKEINPGVIHAHGWKEYACLAAQQCRIPCIVTAHHGGIVCPAGALLNQHDEICNVPADQQICLPCCVRNIRGNNLWLPLLRLIPIAAQLHIGRWLRTKRFIYFITPLGTLSFSIREKLSSIQTLGRYAVKLIAPSPAMHDALVCNGIPDDKVVVVPHGIPSFKRLSLRHDFGKGPIRFLYFGRISRIKGLHIMLEAFFSIPKNLYELHIVGDAFTKLDRRYRSALQQKYKSVNAIWHGFKPHDEAVKHIASCDVIVHPAICLEVYGLTIAESLAIGRPVIASRCGGAEYQIHDGENGMLVPPNDPRALYNALINVIECPELIEKMSEHTTATQTIESHIHALEKIYSQCRSE